MKLALVVLNYNSAEDTLFCVKQLCSLRHSTSKYGDYHIIIVDNASTDNSYQEILDTFGGRSDISIIKSERNLGYSAGNNIGMKYAIEKYNVDVIGILNPDVIIPKFDVLESMCNALDNNPKIAIVGACTINSENEYNPNFSGWDIPSKKNLILNHFLINNRYKSIKTRPLIKPYLMQVECVAGCFFLANAKIMQELDFLDENVFLYNEENILGIKCKQKGYMEAIVLDQFYIHNHKKEKKSTVTFKKKINATTNQYKSRKYLCKKYYSKALLPMLGIVEVLNKIYLALAYIKCKITNN